GRFPKTKGAAVAIAIGLMAGFIGQGSAFILIPAMLLMLKLPVRVTVSSALGIAFCASLGGFLGKWGTNQVSIPWLFVLFAAAIPSAYLGAEVSHRISPRLVRGLLTVMLVVVALQMWRNLLFATTP
ncbi:MAG: sulfite exporter TauE/SafE family protein, partial [Gammaproteobacteria bacterium]